MALPELLAELERDAAARVAAVLADARQRAAELVEAGRRSSADRRASALGQREAALRNAMAERLSRARRDARLRGLRARDRFLAGVREAARERLAAAQTGEAHGAALAGRLDEALAFTGADAVEIQAAPPLVPAMRRLARERGGQVRVTEAGIESGFRVRTLDGRVTIDETLQTRLDRDWPALAIELVARRTGGS